MKNIKNKLFATLVSLVTFLIIPSISLADSSTGSAVGSFSKLEGRVDILIEGAASAVPVKLNDNVSMGDIVRTKSDGKAEITFKDDTTVRLAPETRMKIDEYVFNPDNSRKTGALGLFRGKVRAVVSKTKAGIIPVGISSSSFNINTPTAIAGVKGTDFFVFYDKGMTGVIFKEGSGFVANPNMPDKIVNINAGQITFVATPDAPPLTPRPASNVEMAQHTKDTAPAEKPKEKKEDGQKEDKKEIKEAKAETKGDKDKDKNKDKGDKEKEGAKEDKQESKEDKKGEDKSEVKEAKVEDSGSSKGSESEGSNTQTTSGTVEVAKADTEQAPSMTMSDKPAPVMEAVSFSAVDMTMTSPNTMAMTGGGGSFGFAPSANIPVIPDAVATAQTLTTNTVPDTSTLLPVTVTQPQTLKNTDITINVTFQ